MGDAVNVKLIELIRVRPCLYDPDHSESNSYQVKEHHWADIAAELCINASFLKKRWKVIRDRYRKEWNSINNDPYSEGKSFWRHYKKLSFLESHMNHRPRAIVQKVEQVEVPQPILALDEYDEVSEYVEVLESEQEGYRNEMIIAQPLPVLEQKRIKIVKDTPHKYATQNVIITQPLDQGRLIEMVKAFPHLYDQFDCDYSDRKFKQATWEQIAKDLKSTAVEVKQKWNDLRDRFRREHKKVKNNAKVPYVSTLKFYDQLSFLTEYCAKRIITSNHQSEFVYYEELSNENVGEGDASYQYENEEDSNEINDLFKLDKRDFRIVQFVRNNPVLYDRHHPNYEDIAVQNRKWAYLCSELGQDLDIVKARWKTIQKEYETQSSMQENDPNSLKFAEMLSFLNENHSANVPESVTNISKYADAKIVIPPVKSAASVPQKNLPSPSIRSSPITTKPFIQNSSSSSTDSYVKMFFDSIAAQIEAENLPFRYFSAIQQDVLKVVHEQISTYLEDQQ